jgi:predicted Fe-Mo cluster-binding NifX family protein
MKIAVSANGPDLNTPASPVFGRCPTYVFVDTDSMASESAENPAINAAAGGHPGRPVRHRAWGTGGDHWQRGT